MQPRHIVTIVVAVCAAAVLAPVGVMAATGQLVNITDPYSSARAARVSADGSLRVESRAGVTSTAFDMLDANNTTLTWRKLYEAGYPYRMAVTEVSVGVRGTDNGYATEIELAAYLRTSGTFACGGSGWTRTSLRRFLVKTNETVQLSFSGPPLVLPVPASGQRVCFGYNVAQLPNGVVIHAGGTGYLYQA